MVKRKLVYKSECTRYIYCITETLSGKIAKVTNDTLKKIVSWSDKYPELHKQLLDLSPDTETLIQVDNH